MTSRANVLRMPSSRAWAVSLVCVACTPAAAARTPTVATSHARPGPPATYDAPVPGLGPLEVIPDVAGADGCADAVVVTLDAIARGEHEGERVALVGLPMARKGFTLKYCGPPTVCCNQCTGGWVLGLATKDVVELVGIGDCSGLDCNYHCEPFGRAPTHRYRFVGRIEHTPHVVPMRPPRAPSHMTVEKFCKVAEDDKP